MRILIEYDALLPSINEAVDYVNVGPDHDLVTLGHPILQPHLETLQAALREAQLANVDRDHRMRCAICLDGYDIEDHLPFQLSACNHLIGQGCIASWLNSTHEQATTCPHCRAVLCARRPRRPAGQTEAQTRRMDELDARHQRVQRGFGALFHLTEETQGRHEKRNLVEVITCFFKRLREGR